ncbi:MAG: response regulator transcription factor [Bacteriovoracaceae bacterium]|nr:response regulator transcription factor [Bacteriovoracaceae bacterium]
MKDETRNQLIYLLEHQKRSIENLEAQRLKFKSEPEFSFTLEQLRQDNLIIIKELENILSKKEEQSKSTLSKRENEILVLLSEGFANKEIAYQLSISERTVQFHIKSLFTKIEATSRTDVVIKAIKIGLLTI